MYSDSTAKIQPSAMIVETLQRVQTRIAYRDDPAITITIYPYPIAIYLAFREETIYRFLEFPKPAPSDPPASSTFEFYEFFWEFSSHRDQTKLNVRERLSCPFLSDIKINVYTRKYVHGYVHFAVNCHRVRAIERAYRPIRGAMPFFSPAVP
jgi:hypothetical protein